MLRTVPLAAAGVRLLVVKELRGFRCWACVAWLRINIGIPI